MVAQSGVTRSEDRTILREIWPKVHVLPWLGIGTAFTAFTACMPAVLHGFLSALAMILPIHTECLDKAIVATTRSPLLFGSRSLLNLRRTFNLDY